MRTNVKLLVDAAGRNREIMGGGVEDRLRRVISTNSKLHRILEETTQVKEGCLNG